MDHRCRADDPDQPRPHMHRACFSREEKAAWTTEQIRDGHARYMKGVHRLDGVTLDDQCVIVSQESEYQRRSRMLRGGA